MHPNANLRILGHFALRAWRGKSNSSDSAWFCIQGQVSDRSRIEIKLTLPVIHFHCCRILPIRFGISLLEIVSICGKSLMLINVDVSLPILILSRFVF
jgi:hypothetical protein